MLNSKDAVGQIPLWPRSFAYNALLFRRSLSRYMDIPVLFSLWLVAFWKFIISTKFHWHGKGSTHARGADDSKDLRAYGFRVNGPLLLRCLHLPLCRGSLCAIFAFCWYIIHYAETFIVAHFCRIVFLLLQNVCVCRHCLSAPRTYNTSE